MVKKYVKKAKNSVKTVAKYVKKNPNTVVTGISIAKMAIDVARLMSMVNSEKKQFQQSATLIQIGQQIGNLNGYYSVDITPVPAQGTTSITRNGNSLKLHSSFIRFQFSQLPSTTQPIRVKIRLDLVKGSPNASVGTWPIQILEPNPFISGASIYDYNSNNSPDQFGTFKNIFTRKVIVKPDQLTGQNSITNVDIPLKYFKGKGHHVRFANDGSIAVSDGQLIMSMLCDNGNASLTTVGTLVGPPIGSQAISTGLYMSYSIMHYFYDN